MPDEEYAGPDLRDYLSIARRRKWTIVLSVAVVVAISLTRSFLTTPVYRGAATVLLQPRSTDTLFNPSAGARNDPARAVDTEIEVLKSEAVRDMVRAKLGSAPMVSAAGVASTDVIEVSATSTSPALAAELANAYASAYIDLRRKQAVDDLLAAGEEIQTKIDDLQTKIDDLDARINAVEDPIQQAAVRENVGPQKNQLVTQQGTFKHRLDQFQVEAGLTTGRAQLVTQASTPTSPIKPTPLRSGLMALVAGLVVGVALALLRDHLDDSINTKADLGRAVPGLPVIGVIPAVAEWKDKSAPRVVSLANSRSPAAEAYGTLRTSLQFLRVENPLRILQITSPGAQEGKSTTIANLAVALAGMGQRVIIVCCDLRRPRIHEFFGLDNSVGLTSVLVGDTPLQKAIRQVVLREVAARPSLSLLTSGPLPPNPADLLSSQRAADVLTALQAQFDMVLIDSPPVLPVPDSLILSSRVNATLLACLAGVTSRREVYRSAELLRQVDAPLMGMILNGVSGSDGSDYYYRYYGSTPGPRRSVAGARMANPNPDRTIDQSQVWRRGLDGQMFRQKNDGTWWWQASDLLWYPEEAHPRSVGRMEPPTDGTRGSQIDMARSTEAAERTLAELRESARRTVDAALREADELREAGRLEREAAEGEATALRAGAEREAAELREVVRLEREAARKQLSWPSPFSEQEAAELPGGAGGAAPEIQPAPTRTEP